ncbi:MAG: tRNA (adenosine(37)-N6)-dimethylallyltransferase MiaA [Bacteroidia bacterium]
MENKKYLISIVGPTAVGKTALAIELAKHYKTVILSADSRQFYKEISIGTAKPSQYELNEVRHYFIDNKSVTETYSAGDFERDAMELLSNLYLENDIVILVGGSGLYIKALWEGLDEMPPVDEALRQELSSNFEQNGITYLQEKLRELDAHKLENIDTQNPQRLMRAIEIASQNITLNKVKLKRPFEVIKICLNRDREQLYETINKRVDIMINNGLLKECEQMVDFRGHYALKTVGYTEVFEFFDGVHSLPKAIELIKQHSRNYAKRQITWFKREADLQWFEPNETTKIIEFINNKMA